MMFRYEFVIKNGAQVLWLLSIMEWWWNWRVYLIDLRKWMTVNFEPCASYPGLESIDVLLEKDSPKYGWWHVTIRAKSSAYNVALTGCWCGSKGLFIVALKRVGLRMASCETPFGSVVQGKWCHRDLNLNAA